MQAADAGVRALYLPAASATAHACCKHIRMQLAEACKNVSKGKKVNRLQKSLSISFAAYYTMADVAA